MLTVSKNPSKYPLHQELVDDKITFRNKVMKETGQDIKWVKTELSKINNLDKIPSRYNNYLILQAYYYEARLLSEEIITTAEPSVLAIAETYAKHQWKKIWNDKKKEYKYELDYSKFKESSLFFFIWTQYERQIRNSMMSCFDEPESCHQVHDAVYSKQQLDPSIIEAKVLKDTGFKVKISH